MNSTSEQRLHILIVDDVPENITVIAGALDSHYNLQYANSGRQALDLIQMYPPDLVLLDIMMPEMDGIETLRRLRAEPWGRDVPVILITADNSTDTQVRGLGAGADDFLAKPIVIPVLIARVRNIIERRTLMSAQAALVTSLEQANRELVRLAELNAAIFNSAGEGIYSTDTHGLCTAINPAALLMLGYHRGEILGRHQHAVFHHSHPDGSPYPEGECPIFATLQDGQTRTVEETFIRKDGSLLPVQLTVTVMRNEGRIVGSEVLFQDIAERKRMEQELHRLVTTDDLTGTCNRRHFFQLGDAECSRISRYHLPAGLLMLDLDHFKAINDQYGHSTGDRVLKVFANAVTTLLRDVDVFGRIGGEEFAILLPQTDLAGTLSFAERLRGCIASTDIADIDHLSITVSIGATVLTATDSTIENALLRADCAMYEAKRKGRNRVCTQPPEPSPGATHAS